jgi:hypothetical protein
MHPNAAKKILSDEDTLDIRLTAEAVQSAKPEKPKSRANSLKAHTRWLKRTAADEALRQRIKEAWNKRKKI